MPQTYMVAVSPADTGRTWRSALSKRRSWGPRPGTSGTFGADHDCMGSTLRLESVQRSDGIQQRACQLLATHHEVRQVGIAAVVDQRGAVEAGGGEDRRRPRSP